ncbi:MAG: Ferrochelatase [Holosporales bacterium]
MKTDVVLFNLGGPDALTSVRPFLFNLFNDPFIIPAPKPIRFLLAMLISALRQKKAQGIYAKIGGKSPLLKNTTAQADALQKKLGENFRVHICMRYWHPDVTRVIKDLEHRKPDQIIMLPLYPQYSTTTTQSSFVDFLGQIKRHPQLKTIPCLCINSYQTHPLFIQAHVNLIDKTLKNAPQEDVIMLFSAHGIPLDRIEKGDPYQRHVEESVAAIMKSFPDIRHEICYQSKVGPKKWLEPDTQKRIQFFAQQKKNIVVVPIAFVSDHSETLVELDMDYAQEALDQGAKGYFRVPSLETTDAFIDCLSDLCQSAKKTCCAMESNGIVCSCIPPILS